ncbi:hypothetical protein ILUMI_13287 [Ignelater luminosus]|uniref:Apolipophorin-III n=2 Tax=Elateroidea TaxID=71193 RepID=A0A8K0CYU6_IGNLU|nr:hypothetical protein ILUMI_13287 [Ignelater luminosus]
MAKFSIVLFAAFALTAVLAAPKKATEKTQLEQLAEQVQTVANDFSATLQKNLPDSKDVTKAIATQSQEFAHNVENIVKKLETEIESNKGKTDDVLKQVSQKVTETLSSLQQLTGPEATAKANELKTQLDANFKTVAAEFEKLGKTVQPNLEQAGDTVGTFAKGVLDDFLKAAQTFQNQIQTTVSKH